MSQQKEEVELTFSNSCHALIPIGLPVFSCHIFLPKRWIFVVANFTRSLFIPAGFDASCRCYGNISAGSNSLWKGFFFGNIASLTHFVDVAQIVLHILNLNQGAAFNLRCKSFLIGFKCKIHFEQRPLVKS